MPFTGSVMCNSFKRELLQCYHLFSYGANPQRTQNNPTADVFKIALYDNSASMTKTTTEYSSDGEISGAGYVAGGKILNITTQIPSTDVNGANNVVYVSFSNVTWTSASFTAYGALIYNFTQDNRAVAVLDFGGAKTVVAGSFTINFPTYSSGTVAAIIQFQ